MKKSNEPVRGTKDYLPREMMVREKVKSIILNSYKSFGFMQIGTPILEDIENLLGSDGGENLKLIFKVLKRGEKLDLTKQNLTEKDIVDIGLKYDQTVPLVRLYSNNMNNLPNPFKSIQIDSSFRADRPQRGRLRQFTQCDIDILGDASINAEIDIINTTAKTFENLGFENFVARVNDRRILSDIILSCGFDEKSEADVCITLDKMDKIGVSGIREDLIQKGYALKSVECLIASIEKIVSAGNNALNLLVSLGVRENVVEDVKKIILAVNALSTGGFKAIFDISIVRGQNYYTGLVYEFYLPGMSGACAGGGRYDKMIEKMTGKAIPAVGLGLGFEPTCILVQEQGKIQVSESTVAVVYRNGDDIVEVLRRVQAINKKCPASAILAKKNLGFQLETLKANGFTHFCQFPNNEIKEI